MAFNTFATATSDIPLANLDANFTLIGAAAAVSTLYPTASTSITYGTAGTTHYLSGTGLSVAGAATVGTTLGVTGTSTMAAINASGQITLASTLLGLTGTVVGSSSVRWIGSNATATGWVINATSGGSILLDVENTAVLTANAAGVTIPGTLGVTGVSTLTGGATIGTGSNVLGFKVGWLTANNVKTSSTALTTLSDLTIAIGAGETWLIEYTLAATANLETTGISLQVDTPASATQDIFYEYIPQRLDLVGGLYTTPAMVDFGTASGTLVSWTAADIVFGGKAAINVFVRVTASGAGNVTIGYAQETSSGTALNILRGSRVKAQRTA